MNKVSIIMPSYNSSLYIRRSIDSVLNQTYNNWELIIVDDCSTDNSFDIVNDYSCRDNRIKVYSHTVNKGVGYSRYTALEHITGDYVCFLDSDDFYEKDFIETLLKEAIRQDADMVSCGFNVVYPDKIDKRQGTDEILVGLDKYKVDEHDTRRFLWVSLFKKELFDKVKFCKWRYNEDSNTNSKLIYLSNKRVGISYIGYNYCQNDNSLTHKESRVKDFIYTTLTVIDLCKWFEDKPEQVFGMEEFVTAIKTLKQGIEKYPDVNEYKEELAEIFLYVLKKLTV